MNILKKWFSFGKETEKIEVPEPVSDEPNQAKPTESISPKYPPRWLEPSETPFNTRLYDCRELALLGLSVSNSKEAMEAFKRSRSNDGKDLIGKTPENAEKFLLSLTYPTARTLPTGRLFISESSEYKWDIFHFEGSLYFCRCWTGELAFRADINVKEDGFTIHTLYVSKESFLGTTEDFPVKALHFIIQSYLFSKIIPHPIPSTWLEDEDAIPIRSFAWFGRKGQYAFPS